MFERVSILRYFKQHVQGVTKYFPYLLVVDGKKKQRRVKYLARLTEARLGWWLVGLVYSENGGVEWVNV